MEKKGKKEPTFEFIDATADAQSEPESIAVNAGVANLKVLYEGGRVAMPVNLTITTSTGLHRGVHMSRLVKAANSKRYTTLESWLRYICSEVNRTQPGSSVTCELELPYNDQFAKVSMNATERGAMTYRYTVGGMTACPCSKQMIGVGHMQRAEIALVVRSMKPIDSFELISRIGECFSARPKEHMKRLDEAKRILIAQANPKFAEDLVRECAKRFPQALFISGRCFESIHAHDAIATWSSKPGWVPSL